MMAGGTLTDPGEAVSKAEDTEPHHGPQTVGVVIAAVAIPVFYLVFVTHFWMNMLYADEWSVVPLTATVLHGQLTLSALWAQHNENRMLVPNLVFVGVGTATHDDSRFLIALSAAVCIASYWVLLVIFRAYLGRALTPLPVIVMGVVWFSIEDWENTLFGYQFAWYLIEFCFVAMVYLLLVPRSRRWLAVVGAGTAAIVASVSSAQGLALWAVGLICLVWTVPVKPRQWLQRERLEVVGWCAVAAVTTVAYLWGYTTNPTGYGFHGTLGFNWAAVSPSFALHHPSQTVGFFLVLVGEVWPNTNSATIWLTGLLGAAILIAAGYVVVRSLQQRHDDVVCLPVAMIVFALLFDALITEGRVVEGIAAGASQSRYTMANLLILLAIVCYAWKHVRAHVPAAVGLGFVVLLAVVSTNAGLASANSTDRDLTTGARLVVNLDRVSASEQGCYVLNGVLPYLLPPILSVGYVGFREARQDHLSVFSPTLYRLYRTRGLPSISRCTRR